MCLVTLLLPFSQPLKCLDCESINGQDTACNDGTVEATECDPTLEDMVCLFASETDTGSVYRSCSNTTFADDIIPVFRVIGHVEK